jgi:DNA-directed RNA polymerase sigma subunit (sigma70/sigma32)
MKASVEVGNDMWGYRPRRRFLQRSGNRGRCRLTVGETSMGDNPSFSDFDDPVSVYLAEVQQIPPLSREEEIACIRHVRAGDQEAAAAEKRLVEANLLLIVSIAERYRYAPVSMLELLQQGNHGLMHAIRTLSEISEDEFSAHVSGHVERVLSELAGPSDSSRAGH